MTARTLLLALLSFSFVAPTSAAPQKAPETPPAAAPERPATPPRAKLSAADCARCHAAIVKEWRGSMHARSTEAADPLYRTLLAKAVATMGEKAKAKCSRCHYPAWAGVGVDVDVPVEGVSCVVCHVIHPDHPKKRLPGGRHARLAGKDVERYGPEKLCLTCHGLMKSPEGHPVCTTGPESDEAAMGTCTDCHLPESKGHASHAFPGSRDAKLLRSAASLSLAVEGEGEGEGRRIIATVTPGEIGHYVPTGTPMRSMVLTVTALAADGSVIWRNHAGQPLKEAPEATFQHVFSDREGNRPVPAFLAHGKGVDRRLRPEEPRTVRYPLPPKTARVRAVLTYHLAPQKVLEAAKAPAAWREPVTVAEAEWTP